MSRRRSKVAAGRGSERREVLGSLGATGGRECQNNKSLMEQMSPLINVIPILEASALLSEDSGVRQHVYGRAADEANESTLSVKDVSFSSYCGTSAPC